MESMEKVNEFTPRAYQIDLYERAVNEHTIIYLPTGAGKTYIAIMLIKKLSGDLEKSYSEGGKRSIFLVNTVPLVIQQSEYISRLTGLTCRGYSGDMQVDYWKEQEWAIELDKYQVLVMTSQIFLDLLCHGCIELEKINVLIFDECHRAVNDHPMRQIMQRFETCPVEKHPRILALTATLLNCNVKLTNIGTTIKTLENTYHARVASVDSETSIKNSFACPKETIVHYKQYNKTNVMKQMNSLLDDMFKVLKLVNLNNNQVLNESSDIFQPKSKNLKLKSILLDIQEHISITGIYGANIAVLLHLIQLESIKKFMDDAIAIHVVDFMITNLTMLRKIFEVEMGENTPEQERIYKFSSDQVHKLLHVIKNFNENKTSEQKFCCIVFVKRRFTTKVLYHILKDLYTHDENFKFLSPDFLIGFSNDPFKNSKEVLCLSKWNKAVLQRFKSGQTNCIIATDVVDEGIDIPTCTLIIRYDVPMDVRAYIQSKGRARHASSQYTILLEQNDSNYIKRYEHFKATESILKTMLLGNTDGRDKPKKKDINDELYQYKIEPYVVTSEDGIKSIITEQAAISLINRYCSMLLNSIFIHLAPTWILHVVNGDSEDQEKSYRVSLKLPVVSALKEVVYGDVMQSIDLAKRSAALKMCIKLHEIGEFSDNLLPNNSVSVVKNVNYLFPNWVEEKVENSGTIGTYKKKRQHPLHFPSALHGTFPVANEQLYLHIFDASPTYSVPHDNRHLTFYNLLKNKAGFGLLSTKQISDMPAFPIFMNVGELNVHVRVNHETLTLSAEEIEYLRVFHSVIFHEVLAVIKDFMVFDNYNLDNCFLVVPTNADWKIDWDVVKTYQTVKRTRLSAPYHVKICDYKLALVVPTYRSSPTVYIVTQVCDELTPNSCFPTNEYYSYVHYYKERHNLVINNVRQSMIEVKPISKKINCIKPRGMKPGLSKRKRADLLEDFEEHLIPELCFTIHFPALFWLKATMLPSILHRVSHIIIAEELRITINAETNIGLVNLPQDKKWPPLVITEEKVEEEPFEPLFEASIDEQAETVQPETTDLNGPEVDVLNTEAQHYPWTKDQEPPDLNRNIKQIQMIDIEYYCQFMASMLDAETIKMEPKKVIFLNNTMVKVPSLKILSSQNVQGPDPVQILYALTSKLGNDVFDLERLETLGDSYLKFITSLFLYYLFPQYSEGHLTALKGKIIGNRNLYYCGASKDIPGRMKVDDFVPMSNFIAPAFSAFRPLQKLLLEAEVSPNVLYELTVPIDERLSGKVSNATMEKMEERVLNWEAAESHTGMEHFLGVQKVPDKAVADCVEALIGVYLKSAGIRAAARLLKWFQILPNDLNVDQLLYSTPSNPIIHQGNVNKYMPWASKIEERIGYKFNNRGYLLQAFTHPSYTANNITECYQRLEFLGDAILDFLITCYIYETCGDLSPGALTDLRSALVNNITFACLSVRYGLHTALLAYAPKLNDSIDRFVKFQIERNHVVNDELLWILLVEEECKMAEYVDVPKVLGDLLESVIGAIYLDSGKSLSKVWEVIYSLMHKEIEEFSKNVPKQPIRVLYETQGARPQFLAVTVVDPFTVMVPLKVIIAGTTKTFHGFGANKKQAKCAAAKLALKSLLHKA